jgi:endonuclease IV
MAVLGVLDLLFTGNTENLDRAFGKVRKGAKQFKADMEIGQAFDLIGKRGVSAMTGIAAKIAAPIAGFMALKSVIDHVGSQLESISSLNRLAGRLGIATNELQALQSAFKKAGLEGDAVGSTFAKMQNNISQVAHAGIDTGSAFKELGINIKSLNGQNAESQFKTILDQLQKIPNMADRVRLAMQIFGREGYAIAQGFQTGSKAIDEAKKKLDKFGLTINPNDAAQVDAAKKSIADYGLVWEGIWQKITIPALSEKMRPYGRISRN